MNLYVEHRRCAGGLSQGQLNSANAAEFEADVLARLATGPARLILDLAGWTIFPARDCAWCWWPPRRLVNWGSS